MGNNNNKQSITLDDFYMHIQLIGKNMTNFLKLISGSPVPSKAKQKEDERKKVEDFWDFDYSEELQISEQIEEYFKKLFEIKNNMDYKSNKQLKETLIIKLDIPYDNQIIESIFDNLNKLREDYLMPIVLFLLVDGKYEVNIDENKYKRIIPSLIISKKYSEEKKYYGDNGIMKYLLYRFCSIHNELGDFFSIGKDITIIDYDLNFRYFPFNINICCIGRIGQGKSTGVNVLLNEYKAKESSRGNSQTKKLTFYQVSNAPIRILDIPGFDSEQSIKLSVEKFKIFSEEINRLKDYIHIFLYFLNYNENRMFTEYEYSILDEIIKYKDSKIIYVVTHSDKNADEEDLEEYIKKINQGIYGLNNIPDNKKELVYKVMKATKNNVVFVNFHKDLQKKWERFGIKNYFKKIFDFLYDSEAIKEASKTLDQIDVEKKVLELKEKAKKVLTLNKIGGGLIGILPGIDWIVQKFFFKKQIAKKIGAIFGINVKFIENNQKNKEEENIKKIKNEFNINNSDNLEIENYDQNYSEDDNLDLELEVDGDKFIDGNTTNKVPKKIKIAGQTTVDIGGGVTLGVGFTKALSEVGNIAATTTLKIIGSSLLVVGCIVGVGTGYYFTHRDCNQLINAFAQYYKENGAKIYHSYFDALKYLGKNAQNNSN